MNNNQPVSRKDIPSEDIIREAILTSLKSGRSKSFESLKNDVARILNLTPAQKHYRIGESKTTLFENRVHETRSTLHKEGLLEYAKNSRVKLSKVGKDLCTQIESGTPDSTKPITTAQEKVSSPMMTAPIASPPISKQSTNSSNSEERIATPGVKNKAEKYLLSLVLAIIGLFLSTSAIWPIGLLFIIAAFALFYQKRRTDSSKLIAPKVTLVLLALGLVVSFSSCMKPTDSTQEETPATPKQETKQNTETPDGELYFKVELDDWTSSDGVIQVTVTCDKGDNKGFKETYTTVTSDKKTKVDTKAGIYLFDALVKPSTGNENIYTAEKITYEFNGQKEQIVIIKLKIDEAATEEAAAQKAAEEQAAQEAEEQRLREEEEAAAAAAAEAEAAAAAAAAAEAEAAAAAEVERQNQYNGATVYYTDTGSKYHSGSCHHLKKSKHPTTRGEAISWGLGPCGTCNPG